MLVLNLALVGCNIEEILKNNAGFEKLFEVLNKQYKQPEIIMHVHTYTYSKESIFHLKTG
jgi:hypothetical protein